MIAEAEHPYGNVEKRISYSNKCLKETFEMLAKADNGTLENILLHGNMPHASELAGYQYNGYSTWWLTKPLRMAKFTKGFISLKNGRVGVYNLKIKMNALEAEWVPKMVRRYEKRVNGIGRDADVYSIIHFGYGDVYPAEEDMYDNIYQNSMLINYGLNPENSKHPVRNFRDYLVCAVGNDPRVLVGKSYTVMWKEGVLPFKNRRFKNLYIANGALRAIPNFFVLIRAEESYKEFENFFSKPYKQTTRRDK